MLTAHGVEGIDGGALADLGISTLQLDGEGRGFSFRRDEPLDMRMDRSAGPTAAEVLEAVSESRLADISFATGKNGTRAASRGRSSRRANGSR